MCPICACCGLLFRYQGRWCISARSGVCTAVSSYIDADAHAYCLSLTPKRERQEAFKRKCLQLASEHTVVEPNVFVCQRWLNKLVNWFVVKKTSQRQTRAPEKLLYNYWTFIECPCRELWNVTFNCLSFSVFVLFQYNHYDENCNFHSNRDTIYNTE